MCHVFDHWLVPLEPKGGGEDGKGQEEGCKEEGGQEETRKEEGREEEEVRHAKQAAKK